MSKAVWGAVVALAVLGPLVVPAAAGQSPKLDRALRNGSGEARDVIIRARGGRKAAVRNAVERRTGDLQVSSLIDAVAARLSAHQIAELAANPDVESVSLDADVTASGGAGGPKLKKARAGARASDPTEVVGDIKQILGLGNDYTGSPGTVAVIDSGVALNVDFDIRILAQYVFSNGKSGRYSIPYDDYGHGTHIAGLIASSGASSRGKYAGIAPAVKVLSLKVLDKNGKGKTSDVINALEFAVANKARFGITVVNLSLGHPVYESVRTDPLVQAVEAAVRSGLVVVVAAGNYGRNPVTGVPGYAGIASPGNAPSAITVGAALTNGTVARADDRLADYSSRGPSWYDGIAKPDILAPSLGLVSTDAVGSTLDRDYPSLVVKSGTKRYLRLSGSSMSTAIVSGLVALMLDANQSEALQRADRQGRGRRDQVPAAPPLTASAIKALLQYSATPLHDDAGATYSPLEQGAGLVNGEGALELAAGIDTTRRPGEYWLTTDVAPDTEFGGVLEPWSAKVFWGNRLMRGSSVVDLRQAAWEDNIVWGTAIAEDNIVWGTWAGNILLEDNIVWGTGVVWANNIVWGSGLLGVRDGFNIVWGTALLEDNIVWGTALLEDNIVWGTLTEDNIVWGTSSDKVSGLSGGVR